jgi:hypothetical protein
MKNHNIFMLLFAFALVCGCVSCSSNDSGKTANVDELGDTVPASEFAIIEDTAHAPVTGDTIAAKDKIVGDKNNE